VPTRAEALALIEGDPATKAGLGGLAALRRREA